MAVAMADLSVERWAVSRVALKALRKAVLKAVPSAQRWAAMLVVQMAGLWVVP